MIGAAAACAVALHLVLVLDASTSIGRGDWRLQVEATAAALSSDAASGLVEREGGVALSAMGFTESPDVMVPWTVARNAAELRGFAAALSAAERPIGTYTDIAGALDAAGALLDAAPCEAPRRVVDLSTDGEANPWFPNTGDARDRLAASGAVVNAIGVGGKVPGWLLENAVTPGGFAVESAEWADYERGIRRKLVLELAGVLP